MEVLRDRLGPSVVVVWWVVGEGGGGGGDFRCSLCFLLQNSGGLNPLPRGRGKFIRLQTMYYQRLSSSNCADILLG
jgi:hypothetical protein